MKTRPSPKTKSKTKKQKAARNSPGLVVRKIGRLFTLAGVAQKQGRHPLPKDLGEVTNAALVVSNGQIQWLGRERDLPKSSADLEEVSVGGRTVIPAFHECHTHLVFAGSRAAEFEMRLAGVSYQEVARQGGGILSTVQATRSSTKAQLVTLAEQRIMNFVRQGVVSVEFKSGYGLTLDDEIKMLEAGIRAAKYQGVLGVPTFLGPHALAPEFKTHQEYLDFVISQCFPKITGLVDRVDIFIEQGFFDIGMARAYFEAAQRYGFQIVAHADQLSHTGAGVLAANFKALSADHLLQVSTTDIAAIAKSNMTAVLLPTSDFYLKLVYPKARELIDHGARVALATDFNPGTAPSQDLALVGLLARLEMKMTLTEILAGYSYNAAAALGLQEKTGSLEKGKSADLLVLEQDLESLFYSVGSMPVSAVMREGIWLHRI